MALKLVSEKRPPSGRKGTWTKHYLNPLECCPRHYHFSRANAETAPPCPRCGCSHDNLPRARREACERSVSPDGIFSECGETFRAINAAFSGELR
jgi:hypothetical protein